MSTAHVFKTTDGLSLASLRGAIALNPSLRLHEPSKTVFDADPSEKAQVLVIAGGGSGHEPAHAGYTGKGMLSACVAGDVFASPSASQVCTAIHLAVNAAKTKRADNQHDQLQVTTNERFEPPTVLHVINNYTGDRLNFGLAAEKAKREIPGLRVESVVVADDVSLLSRPSLVGPRGLAGNILVCKILGAAAETGASIEEVKALGDAVVTELASIGVGLEHCHVPGRQAAESSIGPGKCEIGLGLHNEPGARVASLEEPSTLLNEMLELILGCGEIRGTGPLVHKDDSVVLFVNNLGGMSTLEMSAILDEVLSQISEREIYPTRVLCSSFMTSLNASGFSLTLLNLSAVSRRLRAVPKFSKAEELVRLIDAPTEAFAWPNVPQSTPKPYDRQASVNVSSFLSEKAGPSQSTDNRSLKQAGSASKQWTALTGLSCAQIHEGIRRACEAVAKAEPELTQYDTEVGDGDCGETFKSGAKAALDALDSERLEVESMAPHVFVESLAEILENSMGGTSGALFGIFFTALANALSRESAASALLSALESLSKYTPARPGDRTVIDSLQPFCEALSRGSPLDTAVKEARKGAESTRNMKPKLGRAVYVRGAEENSEDSAVPPDPGAWGVAILLEGFLEGVSMSARSGLNA